MRLMPFVISLVLCGCCNIAQHRDGSPRPFGGTRENFAAMSEVFVARPDLHYGCLSEAGVAHAYSVILSPVLLPCLLVDLPLEVAADAVTLPFDLARCSQSH